MESSFPQTAPVTIIGAGPVGLVTAYTLAKHGVRCVLVEKRLEATKWPKMDVTNCRSMELLDRLGLAKEFREIGELSVFLKDWGVERTWYCGCREVKDVAPDVTDVCVRVDRPIASGWIEESRVLLTLEFCWRGIRSRYLKCYSFLVARAGAVSVLC